MVDVMKKINFDEYRSALADRSVMVLGSLNRLLEAWGYDLESRKPGIAYVDDQGIPVTDLDLACFLAALVDRRAVITLPDYQVRRAATVREGERVISKKDRHGRIAGLVSNKDVFSFGTLIDDANVVVQNQDGSEEVGAFRTFMIQDLDGTWYEGWDVIELQPFGLDKAVFETLSGVLKTLKFKYFIHPNRWPSFFGRPHLLALMALVRISEESRFTRSEIKRIRESLGIQPKEWPKSEVVGESKTEKFLAFEAEVDGFNLHGEYTPFSTDQEGLDQVISMQRRYRHIQSRLRFQIRASQFAFVKEAVLKNIPEDRLLDWLKGEGQESTRLPAWVGGKGWERGYKTSPKARTHWARMEIQPGLYLRWRVWQKSEKVAA